MESGNAGQEWDLNRRSKLGLKVEEYAVLVGVIRPGQTEELATEYLDELEFLALTAGAKTKKDLLKN